MTTSPDLSRYEIVLLDVNGTFMFGQDRFDAHEDFAATYRRLGGAGLSDETVNGAVRGVIEYLLPRYRDPAHFQNFPSLAEAVDVVARSFAIAEPFYADLERTFAAHEVGHVPADYASTLHTLSKTHRLGIISDIWAQKQVFLDAFADAGIGNLFEHMIFSSDTRHVKPSPHLFEKALAKFTCAASDTIYVGDNLMRDVGGASAVGIDTIWLTNGRAPDSLLNETDQNPTFIIENLLALKD